MLMTPKILVHFLLAIQYMYNKQFENYKSLCQEVYSTYQASKKQDTKICVMYTLNNDRANPLKMSV